MKTMDIMAAGTLNLLFLFLEIKLQPIWQKPVLEISI